MFLQTLEAAFSECPWNLLLGSPSVVGLPARRPPVVGTGTPGSRQQKQALEMLGLQPGAPLGDGLP